MQQFPKGIAMATVVCSLGAIHSTPAADPTAAQISFVNTASQAGTMEVEAAKAALSKSKNTAVIEYAYRMLYDYGRINEALGAIGQQRGVAIPSKLDATHARMLQSLRKASRQAFDAAYFSIVALDHAKTVELLESNLLNSDTELAIFSSYNLPVMREHKRLAEELKSGLAK